MISEGRTQQSRVGYCEQRARRAGAARQDPRASLALARSEEERQTKQWSDRSSERGASGQDRVRDASATGEMQEDR